MTFTSLLSFRKARGQDRGDHSSAGVIVFLMMALVFVPIIAAHMALAWQGQLPSRQLAAIVHAILPAF